MRWEVVFVLVLLAGFFAWVWFRQRRYAGDTTMEQRKNDVVHKGYDGGGMAGGG